MFARLFRRHRLPGLTLTTPEAADALRVAAQFADDPETRIEYTAAADALARAVAQTRRHADAPTRDALAYALGRAELNLKDQLRELIELSKETRMLVQDVHVAQGQQGAAVGELRAEFLSFGENLSERMTGLETRMDTSEADRRQLNAGQAALREGQALTNERLAQIEETLESFRQSRDTSIAERDEHGQRLEAIERWVGLRREAPEAGE